MSKLHFMWAPSFVRVEKEPDYVETGVAKSPRKQGHDKITRDSPELDIVGER